MGWILLSAYRFLANGKVVSAAASFLRTAGNGIATRYAGGAKSIGLVATRKLSRKYLRLLKNVEDWKVFVR